MSLRQALFTIRRLGSVRVVRCFPCRPRRRGCRLHAFRFEPALAEGINSVRSGRSACP
jgi:hypothetical protein